VPGDRRGAYAVITDDGVDLLRKMWPVYRRGIETYFAQPLEDGAATKDVRAALARVVAAATTVALMLVLAVPAVAGISRTARTSAQIREYHDSGAYAKALTRQWSAATRSLRTQLREHPRKPAVVVDIDETTISNYGCLDDADFELTGLADCTVNTKGTAIPGARPFITFAQRRKVAVFFVTGSRDAIRSLRLKGLAKIGVRKPFTLVTRPDMDERDSVVPFKAGERRKIERRGFRILVNVGDQRSDLSGGHARRTVKLPNPVYLIT
jgi:predicted secreted acid phosphatase